MTDSSVARNLLRQRHLHLVEQPGDRQQRVEHYSVHCNLLIKIKHLFTTFSIFRFYVCGFDSFAYCYSIARLFDKSIARQVKVQLIDWSSTQLFDYSINCNRLLE